MTDKFAPEFSAWEIIHHEASARSFGFGVCVLCVCVCVFFLAGLGGRCLVSFFSLDRSIDKSNQYSAAAPLPASHAGQVQVQGCVGVFLRASARARCWRSVIQKQKNKKAGRGTGGEKRKREKEAFRIFFVFRFGICSLVLPTAAFTENEDMGKHTGQEHVPWFRDGS